MIVNRKIYILEYQRYISEKMLSSLKTETKNS